MSNHSAPLSQEEIDVLLNDPILNCVMDPTKKEFNGTLPPAPNRAVRQNSEFHKTLVYISREAARLSKHKNADDELICGGCGSVCIQFRLISSTRSQDAYMCPKCGGSRLAV